MLYATGPSTRRLYRPTDQAHPRRAGRIKPRREQIPSEYHALLDWYEKDYSPAETASPREPDAILGLLGLGAEIWRGEDADAYVRRLREGWE